jgi:hypothetical protein
MADKLDIVIAQQQQHASQLATILERTGEHGARLNAVTDAIVDIRQHTVSCRARTEFARLEKDVEQLKKPSRKTPTSISVAGLNKDAPQWIRIAWIVGAAIAASLATLFGAGVH